MASSHGQTSPSQDPCASSSVPTPQSIPSTPRRGKRQSDVTRLRSHTHVKHYHVITCSGKMTPVNDKRAGGRKEQAGVGDLTHPHGRPCC